jgi:ubiquinone/menaquinone biosynthesis C-methylase UbiE
MRGSHHALSKICIKILPTARQAKYRSAPQPFVDWVLDRLPIKGNERVLDAGCGTGAFLFPLAQRLPQGTVTGVDLVPEMIDLLRSKLDDYPNIQLQQADIQQLPFDDETFDLVFANFVLFHVEDIFKAISECKRVLKPRGTAVFATGTSQLSRLDTIHRTALKQLGFSKKVIQHSHPMKRFSLENGADYLRHHFPWFEQLLLHDQRQVPTVQDVLEYYQAGMIDWAFEQAQVKITEEQLNQLYQLVGERLEAIIQEEGAFRESKLGGVFIAYK